VLGEPLDRINGVVRANKPKRLPVALTAGEIQKLFDCMDGVALLLAQLMYGSGLRLFEAVSLRVKDIHFAKNEIIVRDGKGAKDRVTMLPESLKPALRAHLRWVRRQHERDLDDGLGRVPMPTALARKFPSADKEWGWQWVFPARRHFTDRETRVRHRWHLHESTVQKAVTAARLASGLTQHVTVHTLRHSFATQLLINGYDIRTVQELLGHKSVKTTEIYLHVLNRGGLGVLSPLDGAPPRTRYLEPDNSTEATEVGG
jgi:integron integrase